MIVFVTGQYAGAQYIHPLLSKWSRNTNRKWKLVATNTSCYYWDKLEVPYINLIGISSEKVSLLLDRLKPTLVVVSASANIELEYLFIIEAKKKKIPSASFIDTWTNYSARFRYKGTSIYPDHVLAIDEHCAEEMANEGIPENIIKIIGQPYLESIANDIPDLGEDLLITSQPISKYYKNSLGYDETDFLNICVNAVEKVNYEKVVLTKHPDEELSYIQSKNSNITYRVGKGLTDIAQSHTVLGMFSMQMIIAYIWERKVASIQPGLKTDDPSPLSRWGLIPKLHNENEVLEFISEPYDINNIELISVLKNSNDRFELFCDGRI